jgi:coenzyme F420-reducing hydrogenase delta subunit
MTFLQKLMGFSGINPERLRVRWVSSAEASEFVEAVKKMGPNPLKTKEAA